ncbi:hypothetical protein H6F61_01475 [Cyanobacteria bacterium FACHB-472]|nr:hypothetical protein [Cyanobacteria bacterium FACHB-472]
MSEHTHEAKSDHIQQLQQQIERGKRCGQSWEGVNEQLSHAELPCQRIESQFRSRARYEQPVVSRNAKCFVHYGTIRGQKSRLLAKGFITTSDFD